MVFNMRTLVGGLLVLLGVLMNRCPDVPYVYIAPFIGKKGEKPSLKFLTFISKAGLVLSTLGLVFMVTGTGPQTPPAE